MKIFNTGNLHARSFVVCNSFVDKRYEGVLSISVV